MELGHGRRSKQLTGVVDLVLELCQSSRRMINGDKRGDDLGE